MCFVDHRLLQTRLLDQAHFHFDFTVIACRDVAGQAAVLDELPHAQVAAVDGAREHMDAMLLGIRPDVLDQRPRNALFLIFIRHHDGELRSIGLRDRSGVAGHRDDVFAFVTE